MRFIYYQLRYLLQYSVVMVVLFFIIFSLFAIPDYMANWQYAAAESFLFAAMLAIVIAAWLAIIHRKSVIMINKNEWHRKKEAVKMKLTEMGYEQQDEELYMPDNKKAMGYAGPVIIKDSKAAVHINGSRKILKELEAFSS